MLVFLMVFEGAEASGQQDLHPETIEMNFQDVDLKTFIAFISEVTRKTFLLDPCVRGTVTVIASAPIPKKEIFHLFLGVLKSNGFTIAGNGEVLKIIPLKSARTVAMAALSKNDKTGRWNRMTTRLIPLRYASAAGIVAALRPIISVEGYLAAFDDSETILLTDFASNTDRILKIIGRIDKPGNQKVENFFLHNANAGELVGTLQKLYTASINKGNNRGAARIIANKRTNSIIVAAQPIVMESIRKIIPELDKTHDRPRENIHVYMLEHAIAEDLVGVLKEIPGKNAAIQKGKAPVVSNDVRIFSDNATNSLVMIAPPEEYKILEDIIRKLDIPRTMVYVEALILEVSESKALDLGVEWQVGSEYNEGYASGERGGFWYTGSTTGSVSNLQNIIDHGGVSSGFVAGVVGRGITLGSVTFPSIAAFVRAARTDSDFNIISTPQILTLDNQEAEIEVGQNIPYITRIDQGQSTNDYATQNFEYRDVGVTLKVTPSISTNGLVRMKVEQTVQSVVETTAQSGDETVLAPTTTFRTAKTTIIVRNGDTAVIGGLMENRMNKGTNKTPGLGDVPILGWLFKSESKRDEKTNLLVFITPHILANPAQTQALSEKKHQLMDAVPEAGETERGE